MKLPLGIIFFFYLTIGNGTAQAGLFSIQVNNQGGLTASQALSFDRAANIWQDFLVATQDDLDITLTINASGRLIDGSGGVVGRAGPTFGRQGENFFYARLGVMQFDTADLAFLESRNLLDAVVLHEMAHVIGFGTLWNIRETYGFLGFQEVYQEGSGQYYGQYGLDMYREEFDPFATFVPVEQDGGPGTIDGHWDEDWQGGQNELLTGRIDPPTYLSNTSLASFADIGFVVRLEDGRLIGIPIPATIFLMLTGLLLLNRQQAT